MAQKVRRGRVRHVTPWSRDIEGDIWSCRRELTLLQTQILSERSAKETWETRLRLRLAYERRKPCPSQVPMLRQELARSHTRLLELEHRLATTQVRLRFLLAEQRAKEGS
jgi:hypothetical protein